MSQPKEDTEEAWEARFGANLLNTWKDYSAQIASELNQIQEAGLARILERVISRSESGPQGSDTDPHEAYAAVSNFLLRRSMTDVVLSEEEFLKRYEQDDQLRSVASDIEEVERKISKETAPREALKKLVKELFLRDKSFSLSDSNIEVAIEEKKIGLSTLSSGEKQLLKILIETVIAGPTIILIDEPELSMHVDWQRRLISSMRLLNPDAQLIVATHSPEIMADIPDRQIFRI